jgi:hypothetical protein
MYLVNRDPFFLAKLYCSIFSIVSLLCYFLTNVWRFCIMPARFVMEGGLASLYGMVCVVCICGVWMMVGLVVSSLSNMSAWLIPWMHV